MAAPKVLIKSYTELLAMTKEKIGEYLQPLKAKEQRKAGELQLSQIEMKVLEAEAKVQKLCTEYPIPYDLLLDALDEYALLQRRQSQLQSVLDQLFPVEVATETK